jgi:hypothetical protein
MALISNNDPIGGTAFLTRNGVTYHLGAACTYSVSQKTRESKAGLSGVAGYTTKARAGFIEGTFFDRGGLLIGALGEAVDDAIVLELENGKVIHGSHMWTTTASEVDAAEGTFTARWESGNVMEIAA